MNEFEKLIEAMNRCASMLKEDGFERGNCYLALTESISSAEAMLKRAKVYRGIMMCQMNGSQSIVLYPPECKHKGDTIIAIPEDSNDRR